MKQLGSENRKERERAAAAERNDRMSEREKMSMPHESPFVLMKNQQTTNNAQLMRAAKKIVFQHIFIEIGVKYCWAFCGHSMKMNE